MTKEEKNRKMAECEDEVKELYDTLARAIDDFVYGLESSVKEIVFTLAEAAVKPIRDKLTELENTETEDEDDD